MTESIYAPPESDLGSGETASLQMFYVVSPLKMMTLYLFTMGAYSTYWHYQNWYMYKHHARSPNASVWPVLRALLEIFFTPALLREVDAHARDNNLHLGGKITAVAVTIVLLTIVAGAEFLVPVDSPYYAMSVIFGSILLVPLMLAYRSAQQLINESCGDPQGESNSTFTVANGAWMLIGVLMWVYLLHDL